MCRWYFAGLLFGVALAVALAEAFSRVIEEDRMRRRLAREEAADEWPPTGDFLISNQTETRWDGDCVADDTVRIKPERVRQMKRDGPISWT